MICGGSVFPGIAVGVYQVWAMRVYMRGLGAGGKGLRKRVIVGLINVVLALGLMIGCACRARRIALGRGRHVRRDDYTRADYIHPLYRQLMAGDGENGKLYG